MENRINIMHVVDTLGVGGMENGIVNLANRIDCSRFNLMICCYAEKGPMASRLNTSTQLFELKYGDGLHLTAILSLAKFLKRQKVHIMHAHGWGAKSFYAILAAKIAGTPKCINGEHGSIYTHRPGIVLLQQFLGFLCDGILSVSGELKKRLVSTLNLQANKISVIKNGVDTKKFNGFYSKKTLQREFDLNDNDFVIGVVGSLKRQKNQVILLKALSLLNGNQSMLKVFFIGDGPDKQFLRESAEGLGLKDQAIFPGIRQDIPQLLSMMNVLILPSVSNWEGMSNVILEAMASRVPVITSRSVGSGELIVDGKTGLFFDHEDPADLMDKILLLRNDLCLRQSIAEEAYMEVIQEYSLERMVMNYESYYESLFFGNEG